MEQKPDVLKKFFTFDDIGILVTLLNVHHAVRFFSPVALRSNVSHDLLIREVSRSHTTTHHSR
jgi:hypothetical protein